MIFKGKKGFTINTEAISHTSEVAPGVIKVALLSGSYIFVSTGVEAVELGEHYFQCYVCPKFVEWCLEEKELPEPQLMAEWRPTLDPVEASSKGLYTPHYKDYEYIQEKVGATDHTLCPDSGML